MAALACFFAWGLVPAYWKQIPYVTADEMVTHRVLWSWLGGARRHRGDP